MHITMTTTTTPAVVTTTTTTTTTTNNNKTFCVTNWLLLTRSLLFVPFFGLADL
jgi:hypothetical protein